MALTDKTIKIKINQTLWERLNYFSRQLHNEPEAAIESLLERHLPNLMGNFATALEHLTSEEQQMMEESYYCVMFIVSYADEHASFKETRKIEKQLEALEHSFGTRLTNMLGLDNDRKNQLFEMIKALSSEELKTKLGQLNLVFNKMPQTLIYEYKIHLLESCIAVAQASGESFFSDDNISEVERTMIQTIVQALEIPLRGKHAKVLVQPDFATLLPHKN